MARPDGYVKVRYGSTRPVFGQATISTGTLTISGTPKVSVKDISGSVVAGFDNIDASGWDNTAVANPRAWLNFQGTVSPAEYTFLFSFDATGSDSVSRTYNPEIAVRVLPAA